jgi:hypothetical protein
VAEQVEARGRMPTGSSEADQAWLHGEASTSGDVATGRIALDDHRAGG